VSGPVDQTTLVELPGETVSIAVARRHAVEQARTAGLDGELVDRIELVVSELASNAVQASPGRPYQVEARMDGDGFVVSVTNRSSGADIPAHEAWVPAEPLASRGRGLGIVDHLSAEMSIDVGYSSVRVTARLTPVRT
jgi:anti-sigma regulatory factor (Ser/Thr protein kinase)